MMLGWRSSCGATTILMTRSCYTRSSCWAPTWCTARRPWATCSPPSTGSPATAPPCCSPESSATTWCWSASWRRPWRTSSSAASSRSSGTPTSAPTALPSSSSSRRNHHQHPNHRHSCCLLAAVQGSLSESVISLVPNVVVTCYILKNQ